MNTDDIITAAAAKYGMDPAPWLKTAKIESGGNPKSVNAGSHATGLFQFVPKTWAQYGNGADPFDPEANADAAMRLGRDNQNAFTRAMGRAPTAGETYLMHQQGAQGAMNLLQNPDKPAASSVGLSAVAQNGGQADMTGADFANKWTSQFDGAPAPGPQPTASAPAAGVPTAAVQMPQQNNSALGDAFATAAPQVQNALTRPPQKKRQDGIQFIS